MERSESCIPHDLESTLDPLAERLSDEMFRLSLGHLALIWELIHEENDDEP